MLDLDPEQLSACVSCGLCLPHCPTFRVTGDEAYSPRGRIDAMRSVQAGDLPADERFVDFVETCVQCRGCETACPSNVEFGALMEGTRRALAADRRITPRWQRLGLSVLRHHRIVLAGSTVLAVAQRLRLVPARLGVPRLPIRRPAPLVGTGTDVWFFTGCVMDAWQRQTHRHAVALLELTGTTWATPGSDGACCGALHVHAGLHDDAAAMARRVVASMPGDAPIVVDAAGCGAALRDYGSLLGDVGARFSERVVDVNEFLAARVHLLPPPTGARPAVVVQDPCHLRHVQGVVAPVRTLLGHVADVVELDDDGLCCGAGGAYSVMQPELAGRIRERKVQAIERACRRVAAASGARPTILASANPGCAMHLAAVLDEVAGTGAGSGVVVRHPVDVVAEALGVAG